MARSRSTSHSAPRAEPRPGRSASRRRLLGRPAQQVALARPDPERADDVELGGRLDALGHDERAPAVGQVAQRPDDLEGRVAEGAALDQRQVDLDDVEPELAEQPQAGVPGADVVGRDPDAGHAARLDRAPQPVQVLDRLALGQLEDDPARVQPVADDQADQRVDAEVVHLHRPRREVDREVAGQAQAGGGLHDRVQAGEVELAGPAGHLGRGEHRARRR